MSDFLTPDICVVGSAAGGLGVVAAAAASGLSVVLAETHGEGGHRPDAACIAAKALIAAARQVRAMEEALAFGVGHSEPAADFAAVMRHVRRVAAAVASNESAERFAGLGVEVIAGEARFRDRRTLAVGGQEIRARRFVIATGSRPAIPPIANLETVLFLTHETIFGLKRCPAHLVILGAESLGLELAQAFRRLGSEVTVLEPGDALSAEDPEMAALLLEDLRGEGIDIREGVQTTRVSRRGRAGVRVSLETGAGVEQVDASHLLVAAGPRPALDSLGLSEARVDFDASGVRVDRRFRTTNRRVYAVGDVVAGPRATGSPERQAALLVGSILTRFGARLPAGIRSRATFTDPELVQVGLTEVEARRRHAKIQVLRWPYSENDRARADGATRGLVKILATRRGHIVGAAILARDANELAAPLVLAMAQRLSVKSLAAAGFSHPTRAEAAQRAAMTFDGGDRGAPRAAGWKRLLARFG